MYKNEFSDQTSLNIHIGLHLTSRLIIEESDIIILYSYLFSLKIIFIFIDQMKLCILLHNMNRFFHSSKITLVKF